MDIILTVEMITDKRAGSKRMVTIQTEEELAMMAGKEGTTISPTTIVIMRRDSIQMVTSVTTVTMRGDSSRMVASMDKTSTNQNRQSKLYKMYRVHQ